MTAKNSLGLASRRLAAIIVKEALQIVRDPSSILIGFILPVFLTLLSGFATNLDIDHVPIGLALEDSSPEAQDLAAAFLSTKYFKTRVGHDRREFTADLVAGKVRGIVVIPQTFSRDLARAGESVPFQVIADGSEPNTATFAQNYAQGVWLAWMQIRAQGKGAEFNQPVTLAPRTWYNQELVSLNSLLPGGMAINLTLIGALLTALVVAREWERGTMEAMLATPVGRFEMLLGKLVPYFLLGMFNFEGHDVRVVYRNDQPWFVTADVCLCLGLAPSISVKNGAGYAKYTPHIMKLDADEKKVLRGVGSSELPTHKWATAVSVISESGLYKLIMLSERSNYRVSS